MQKLSNFHKFILSIILFVSIFYKQNVGVNYSILNIFIWMLSYYNLHPSKKRKTFWLLSAALLISTLAFAWYGDISSFISLFFSIGAIGIYTQYEKIDILLYPVLLTYSLTTFIGRIFFFKKWLPQSISTNLLAKKVFACFVIPVVFVTLFVVIYAAGSATFSSILTKIPLNIDMIIFGATILSGFYFMFNYWFMMMPVVMMKWNEKIDYTLYNRPSFKPTFSFLDIDFERKSGEITLLFLNILLIFFIVTYNMEIFGKQETANVLSDEVHARINAVIFSIVMAIGVIMFYFKSTFNFDIKAGRLKKLSICWILLNGLLIISAASKNAEYVINYGLTFKRIGVYIFLLLSIAGLLFTFLKINHRRSNLFLLSRMLIVFFITLVVNSSINWSWIVTKYDLAYAPAPDIAYLQSLDFNKQIMLGYYQQNHLPVTKIIDEIKNKQQQEFLSANLYYDFIRIK